MTATTWTSPLDMRRVASAVMLTVLGLFLVQPAVVQPAAGALMSVIVREDATSGSLPEETVQQLGGDVQRHINLINGFTATVPSGGLDTLQTTPGVMSVTENAPVELQSTAYDANTDPGSLYNTINSVKARDLWRMGYTGKGVDVALIDSGVLPVNGLTTADKVVHGPDLSFEGGSDNTRYLDTFGHGTHLAGIIAGKGNSVTAETLAGNNSDKASFVGLAPDARIVNVKVANALGTTDVSQVLAAIDWVVQHRNDNGMNIRVLNLSFGTDGTQDYRYDPLTYAAEVAWHKGIVVVVAAGNGQFGNSQLNNPAYDPYVIAVGANDTKGTYSTDDDVVPDWSARGDGTRNPDLVAPGKSIQSLRAPGSVIDEAFADTGRISDRFFRGTGTSQSAAVVSGAAALLLQQRPNMTPDQVKALLKGSATHLPVADDVAQGAGALDLKTAAKSATPTTTQNHERANGTGSLEEARGTVHVASPEYEFCVEPEAASSETASEAPAEEPAAEETAAEETTSNQSAAAEAASEAPANESAAEAPANESAAEATGSDEPAEEATATEAPTEEATASEAPTEEPAAEETASEETASEPECYTDRIVLAGEQDAHGSEWNGATWSGATWSGATWSGGDWNGATWSGATWSGATWSGATWSGATWSGATWSGATWSGATWSGATWSGATWSGASWNGATWSGATWSGATWSGATWSGATWSGATWSGATWSGATWSGATWSGATWSGATWSGATWSGATWSGATWSGASWS